MLNKTRMLDLYMNMITEANLTHHVMDDSNSSHLLNILQENFPWPPDMRSDIFCELLFSFKASLAKL